MGDAGVESPCAIDLHFSADAVAGKHEGAAGSVAAVWGQPLCRTLRDGFSRLVSHPSGDRVAGKEEDTQLGPVCEVPAGFLNQIEASASVVKILAPQQLVVPAQGRAVFCRGPFPAEYPSGSQRTCQRPKSYCFPRLLDAVNMP